MPSQYSEAVVSISRLTSRGRGGAVLHRDPPAPDIRVEVIGGIPGDTLRVQLGPRRHGKARANIQEVITPSPLRVAPQCIHVPDCGGCAFQAMAYSAQLQEKEESIKKLFAPLGETPIRPIIPCASPWRYRNKMEFSFSQNRLGERFLGLMIAGARGKVLNLSECHLADSWFIDVLKRVRTWWEDSGLGAYRMNDTGSLRTLTLRHGIRTHDKMVILTVSGNPAYALNQSQLRGFVDAVKQALPSEQHERLSIFLRIHQIQKGFPTQFYEIHLHGPDHLTEELTIDTGLKQATLRFKISPNSFFQPNTLQAEKLYSTALQLVSPTTRHVLDLYAGTATLGLAMALQAEFVTAIELNPYALFDAQVNQETNRIENMRLMRGDVGEVLAQLKNSPDFTLPDLVILDPPRAGLDLAAMTHLLTLKPQQILYISCNPLTQADNVKQLISAGYHMGAIQPVDQFPHTVHIENIILLNRS